MDWKQLWYPLSLIAGNIYVVDWILFPKPGVLRLNIRLFFGILKVYKTCCCGLTLKTWSIWFWGIREGVRRTHRSFACLEAFCNQKWRNEKCVIYSSGILGSVAPLLLFFLKARSVLLFLVSFLCVLPPFLHSISTVPFPLLFLLFLDLFYFPLVLTWQAGLLLLHVYTHIPTSTFVCSILTCACIQHQKNVVYVLNISVVSSKIKDPKKFLSVPFLFRAFLLIHFASVWFLLLIQCTFWLLF